MGGLAFALIIGLVVAVVALSYYGYTVSRANKRYEQELMKKARKGKK